MKDPKMVFFVYEAGYGTSCLFSFQTSCLFSFLNHQKYILTSSFVACMAQVADWIEEIGGLSVQLEKNEL